MDKRTELIYKILLDTGNSAEQAERLANEISKITASSKAAAAAAKALEEKQKVMNKLNEDTSRAAGLAGAATFELGRTISDLPFGIQAVTNNISQMGNLFAALVANAGGLTKALAAIRAQLLGPTGILVAFQVVIAAITFFTKNQKKSEEETVKTNASLERQIISIRNLRREFEASGGNAEVLQKSAIINEDIANSYAAQLLTVEEVNRALQLQEDIKTAQEEITKREEADKEAIKLLEEEKARILKDQEKTERVRENLRRKGFTDAQIDAEMESRRQKELEGLEARRANLRRKGLSEEQIMLETKEQESDVLRTIEQVEKDIQDVKEATAAIDEKRLSDARELADLERLGLERMKARRELSDSERDLREKALEDRLRRIEESGLEEVEERRKIIKQLYDIELERLEDQKQQELRNVTDPEIIAAINGKYKNLAKIAGVDLRAELDKAVVKPLVVKVKGAVTGEDLIDGKELTDAQKVAQKQLEDYADKNVSGLKQFVKNNPRFKKKKKEVVEEFTLSDGLKELSTVLGAAGDLLGASIERDLAMEKNKTTAINDQLRARLANEQLSAEERDKINQQIAQNEAELVRKENELNKKRFQQEKAFGIAQATINTYIAASDVLAREKMGVVGKIVATTAVIAAGLAQVATIAKQQFVAKAMPAPNLSAQGGGRSAEPAFNIVGASNQSQLAQAIAAQNAMPVKAYVVSSDVSTAQQLERNIIQGASI